MSNKSKYLIIIDSNTKEMQNKSVYIIGGCCITGLILIVIAFFSLGGADLYITFQMNSLTV